MEQCFYQSMHGIDSDYFIVEQHEDFAFPLHLHRCFEIILMLEGSMTVTLDGIDYLLSAGDMILIKPHRIHGLRTEGQGKHILCIFSPELIGHAGERFQKQRLTSPVLSPDTDFYRTLFLSARDHGSKYGIKGFLYYLCDAFEANLTEEPDRGEFSRDVLLLHRVLTFIEQHYRESCSLASLTEEMNYSYTYLSRFFADRVGITYNAYVTRRRLNQACYLLQNTEQSVSDIAYACGFTSIRSFNRNFREMTGVSPTDFR